VKVRVEKALCTGHARCNVLGPDVFPLDDDGYCAIDELVVPAGLEQQARAGAAGCPERAITIEE
jgi:ferredoxin